MNRGSMHPLAVHRGSPSPSMRPRFMNRGSPNGRPSEPLGGAPFNEAPIHESGKCRFEYQYVPEEQDLQ